MRATEFVTEVSQYKYYNPATPPVATTAYDAKEMGKNWKQTARQTQSARQDPEYRYYAGKNPLSAPVPLDDPEPLNIPSEDELEKLEATIDLDRLRAALKSTMSSLTPVERSVLTQRFFNDMSLAQVARLMSLTPERIRQIEAKALRKMRHPVRADHLAPFVDPNIAPPQPASVAAPAAAVKPQPKSNPVITTPKGRYDREVRPVTADDIKTLAQMKAQYADHQQELAQKDQRAKENRRKYRSW
jgi:RNA polymerase sigma factor (sigma-70 family)